MDRTSWQTIKCGIKLTILLSILLWSGILVVGLHRQYQLLAKAKDQVEKDLVGFGFSSSKMAEKQSGSSLLTGQTALLHYLQDQRNVEDNAATVAAWKQQKAGKSSLVRRHHHRKYLRPKPVPQGKYYMYLIIKAMTLQSITEQSHRQGRLPSIVHQKHQNAGKYKRKSCSLLIRETKRQNKKRFLNYTKIWT
mgnify:CR=1 FL=1